MKLGRAARKQLDELIARAVPLNGDFFRSVAFHYFHPDDVISGDGTRLNGGRFVPVGVKAVYQAGAITLTDVLDADRQLLVARNEVETTRSDAARAAVSTFRALGGGWDVQSNPSLGKIK